MRTNHVYKSNSLIWRSFGIFAALDTCHIPIPPGKHSNIMMLLQYSVLGAVWLIIRENRNSPTLGVLLGKLCALAPLWSIRILLVLRSYSLPLPVFDLRTTSQVGKPRRCAFCVRRSYDTSIHSTDQYRIQVYEPGIEWWGSGRGHVW